MDFQLTEEQRHLQRSARRLAQEQFAAKAFTWDVTGEYPWDNAKTLANAGLAGITISEELGGQGGTLSDAVLVMEAVSEVCPNSGDFIQATNFGAIRQVAEFGSERLRKEILPILLAGDGLISVGMSEAEAGSGLTDLTTAARVEADEIVIDGVKMWNSNGPHITHVVVWCRFGERTRDIGAVVVPVDTPGFSKGDPETYMSGEQYCALYLDDVRVPREYALAEGNAFQKMMTVFGVERIGNGVRALALAQHAFDLAVEHAKDRQQFGRPLCEFQGLQWKFADMRVQLDAARLLLYRAVVNADRGAPDPTEASIAKLFANETAFRVANDALQVFGAAGYSTTSPLEYIARRVRGWMIAGGSVEMQRNRIAADIFQRRFSQRSS